MDARNLDQLARLQDFASRIGQRTDTPFPPDETGEVYTADNLAAAAWKVEHHAALVDAFLEPCSTCGGHGMVMDFGGPADCRECDMGYVVRSENH